MTAPHANTDTQGFDTRLPEDVSIATAEPPTARNRKLRGHKMLNNDSMYVQHLEAALASAEEEIKALEYELNRCHKIMYEQHNALNPTFMGEPIEPEEVYSVHAVIL